MKKGFLLMFMAIGLLCMSAGLDTGVTKEDNLQFSAQYERSVVGADSTKVFVAYSYVSEVAKASVFAMEISYESVAMPIVPSEYTISAQGYSRLVFHPPTELDGLFLV